MLGQFLLRSRMEREIERMKSMPPRWQRPMIFKTAEQAASFVGTVRLQMSQADNPSWQRAGIIMAETYGFYSWPEQARQIAIAIASLEVGTAQLTHGGTVTSLERSEEETQVTFTVAQEDHHFSFHDYDGACVPVIYGLGECNAGS